MNFNWPRWIKTSINKHFDENRNGLYLHVEGMDRYTNQKQEYFELRTNGPFIKPLNVNYWTIMVEINTLISTIIDDEDLYRHEKNIGTVLNCYTNDICIKRYGDGENDDGTFLGTLQIQADTRNDILVANLGQVDEHIKIMRSSILASYKMNLTQEK